MKKIFTPILVTAVIIGVCGFGRVETASAACSIAATTVRGATVVMGTDLTPSLASGSPAGPSVPGYNEVLRLNFAADSCGNAVVRSFNLEASATDNSANGWISDLALNGVTVVDTATGYVIGNYVGYATSGGAVFTINPGILVAAGNTRTLSFYVDTMGASAVDDDSIRLDLSANSLRWNDGLKTITETNTPVYGGTIIF